jgi:hypothetical protein
VEPGGGKTKVHLSARSSVEASHQARTLHGTRSAWIARSCTIEERSQRRVSLLAKLDTAVSTKRRSTIRVPPPALSVTYVLLTTKQPGYSR